MFFRRETRIDRIRDASPSHARRRRFVPGVRRLEGRKLLAAAAFDPSTGELVINLSQNPITPNSGEGVTVGQIGSAVSINNRSDGIVSSTTGLPLASVAASQVTSIVVNGTAYADRIDLSMVGLGFTGLKYKATATTISGFAGADEIIGSAFNDVINGGNGEDKLYGGNGNDQIYGNAGSDHLNGGAGQDHLYGGIGQDFLNGGDDDMGDFLFGGDGADVFTADWATVSVTINQKGYLVRKNVDAPQDLNTADGDSIV